jgi:hypothetical protein
VTAVPTAPKPSRRAQVGTYRCHTNECRSDGEVTCVDRCSSSVRALLLVVVLGFLIVAAQYGSTEYAT